MNLKIHRDQTSNPKNSSIIWWLFLMAVVYYPLHIPFMRGEEPRRAIVAIEMLESGNFIMPQIAGFPYLNKPPVFNWLLAVPAGLLESYEPWVFRLVGASSMLLLGFIVFYWTKKIYGAEKGFILGLASICTADMLYFFSLRAEIDIFYSCLTSIQLLCIYPLGKRKKWLKLFLISYACCAIGFITKGLPSLAFQALSLLTYFIWIRDWKRLFYWQHFVGIALFSVMLFSYFMMYNQHYDVGAFLANLVFESSKRTTLSHGFGEWLTLLYRLPLMLIKICLPWSLLLLLFFKRNITGKQDPFARFVILLIAVNLSIYALSPETRDRYLYPFIPLVIIFLFDRWWRHPSFMAKWTRFLPYTIGCLFLGSLIFTMVNGYYLQSAISLLSLVAGIYIYRKNLLPTYLPSSFALIIIFLLSLRHVCNLTFYPYRAAHSTDIPLYAWMEKNYNLTDAPIGYLSAQYEESIDVPFLDNAVSLDRIAYIPWQVIYQLERLQKGVVQWTDDPDPGVYLSTESFSNNYNTCEIVDRYFAPSFSKTDPLVFCKCH